MAGFVDWGAIMQDYILTGASFRDLAEKYGVSKSSIAKKCKTGGWVDKRGQFVDKVDKDVLVATKEVAVNRAMAICESADKLLVKVNQILELEDALSPRDLKSISSTLLDLKMIHGIKDEETSDVNKDINIVMSQELEEYCV